ncbi:BAHD acyltransferase BIA1-like [Lotus japonicus]|uniref:BAHD acyltransferase BIA1-like n=1 Tax=Lotus japonicus TaxID=34305 RepID=UPI002582F37F|nr:BAHD acyltransferase BIA1-like [Lotus japonicus]
MSGTSGNIEFEILHRKCIKPSTPTLSHLKTFKLSLLDQLSPDIHGNITFFFNNSHSHSQFSTNSQLLQTSLSQTLTLFYPLAGRLHHPATAINCNDHGAFFIEAQTTTTLSDLLTNPHFNTLESLIPSTDEETVAMSNGSMLLIRFTLFGCGGTAVSISLTHKIADFSALITLLKTWTAVCGGATELPAPELTAGAVLFPQREIPGMSASVITVAGKFAARRFIFNASKVDELKNRVKVALQSAVVGGGAAFHASRVEVVLALIWRCALLAASCSSKTVSSFRPSALFQAVNLRPRMEPAVSDTAVGNFVWPFAVTVEEESHLELHEMVWRMREAMKEFLETKAGRFREEGGFEVVMECLKERALLLNRNNKDIVVYKCTSWCKFPLLGLDFGWGKPVWSCSVNNLVSNTIALMDTKDGGVEACVTLSEEEMDLFQQDEHLLQYALLNPGVII